MTRWKMNIYILWFSQIISLAGISLCFPFIPFYIQEMGITDIDSLKVYTGIINSVTPVAMGIMAPIWGRMSDRFGKKAMLLRSVLSLSIILILMGIAVNVEQLIVLRVFQGLLTGTVTAATALVASSTPDDKLSWSLGFFSSSTFIGISAGPAIGGILAESIGYRNCFFAGSLLVFLNFLIIVFFVKELNPSSRHKKHQMEATDKNTKIFNIKIIIFLLILLLIRISRTIFNPYIALYVQEIRGMIEGSARTTGMINGIAGFFSALSGIIIGRIADKFNKIYILIYSLSFALVFILAQHLGDGLLYFTIFYALFFLSLGGIEPLIMSITSAMTPARKRGTLFGIQAAVGCIGWALAPVIGGYISVELSIFTIVKFIPFFILSALAIIIMLRSKIRK